MILATVPPAFAEEAPASGPAAAQAPPASPGPEEFVPPPPTAPLIVAPALPDTPASGKARLTMTVSGNRRWCTFPDDRLVKGPPDPRQAAREGEPSEAVYTFGYQFTIAAVRRGVPAEPIMLFESPVYRTAEWRPASKAGRPVESPGPMVGPATGVTPKRPSRRGEADGMVPFWNEVNRCATLPARFDFDIDPGLYDLYMAFDLLTRQGSWVHRMGDFLVDVSIEADRPTLLRSRINGGGEDRTIEFDASSAPPGGRDRSREATGP